MNTDCLIIGGGPAAYTAAIYTGRASINTLLVCGPNPGGQLMNTKEVENYPGFENAIMGPDLMNAMKAQAERFGAKFINQMATEVDFSSQPLLCKLSDETSISAKTIIVATGAQPRYLGVQGEKEYEGRGVSYCATCDGFFFKGKEIAVVGGGSAAVEEALFLSRLCSKVTLIHRRDTLRAEKILQEKLLKTQNIEVLWNCQVEEILGQDGSVTTLSLYNNKQEKRFPLEVSGVFIAIGHVPNTEIFKGQVELNKENYINTVPDGTATNIEGVFAAGDVMDHVYRQAVTAAGAGCMAALDVEKFLS